MMTISHKLFITVLTKYHFLHCYILSTNKIINEKLHNDALARNGNLRELVARSINASKYVRFEHKQG